MSRSVSRSVKILRSVIPLVLLLAGAGAGAVAQPAAPESLSFRLSRPGAPIPSYSLTVQSDGSTVYQVSYPPEVPKYSPYVDTIQALPNIDVTMNVNLTPATTAKLFELARATGGFRSGCESKAKHIANSGAKTLTYTSSAGAATCTFNFSEDKNVVALLTTFTGIAYTLDAGRQLELKHRYDRLALDPETENLVTAVRQGSALELSTIAPALRALVDDPQVLERVRNRAANLLALAATSP